MAVRVLAAMAVGLPNFVSLFHAAYPVWRRYRWTGLVVHAANNLLGCSAVDKWLANNLPSPALKFAPPVAGKRLRRIPKLRVECPL